MMKAIISGYGYVGKATSIVLRKHMEGLTDLQIQDPALGMVSDSWEDAAYHFVCVPTPSSHDASAYRKHDISIVRDAIHHARFCGFDGVTVIRSTMSPSDIDSLSDIVDDRVLAWPEFLRKATYEQDALNPLLSIVGGEDAMRLQREMPGYRLAMVGDARTACMAKMAINSYLAARLVIACDIKKACDALGVNWVGVRNSLASDPRIGYGHWDQPGSDGLYGFGGGCLPKDTDAMARLMQDIGNEESYAAWATDRNGKIR